MVQAIKDPHNWRFWGFNFRPGDLTGLIPSCPWIYYIQKSYILDSFNDITINIESGVYWILNIAI